MHFFGVEVPVKLQRKNIFLIGLILHLSGPVETTVGPNDAQDLFSPYGFMWVDFGTPFLAGSYEQSSVKRSSLGRRRRNENRLGISHHPSDVLQRR